MSNPTPTRPRGVTFSPFSTLAFIPKDEADSKWYSRQEKHRFRLVLIRDARRMARTFKAAPADGILPEQLYECVGIEVLVTQGLARHAAEKKRKHVDAVLSEQSLQKQHGACDLERLSGVSKTTSSWTTERARKLATGYCELLND